MQNLFFYRKQFIPQKINKILEKNTPMFLQIMINFKISTSKEVPPTHTPSEEIKNEKENAKNYYLFKIRGKSESSKLLRLKNSESIKFKQPGHNKCYG